LSFDDLQAFFLGGWRVNQEFHLTVLQHMEEAMQKWMTGTWQEPSWFLCHDNTPVHTMLLYAVGFFFYPALLGVQRLRKVVPRPEVLPSITSSACIDSVTEFSGPYWAHRAIVMVSEYPKMSRQGTVGRRKHVTLTIPQKL
jgi:hypothetical protein